MTPFYPRNLSPSIPFPDAAFSPWYRLPDGVAEDECRHVYRRQGTGPWPGKLDIGFTADCCANCGRVMRSVRDISWKEYFWARRYNARLPAAVGRGDLTHNWK